jgi:hypothetical protein
MGEHHNNGQVDPQQLLSKYATGGPQQEDLTDLQGLSLHSSPVKPSSSSGRASSSEPSSGKSLPMFVQQEDIEDLDDDDDEEGGRKGKKGIPNPGRRKIEIEYIEDKVSLTSALRPYEGGHEMC